MKLEDLLGQVEASWHQAFLRFIETGEADSKFLAYLDRDKDAQEAVDRAFSTQAAAFETLARELKDTESPSTGERLDETPEAQVRLADVTASIAAALEGAIELPPPAQVEAIENAVRAVEVSVGPARGTELKSVAQQLGRRLARAVSP